jgi:hypothetical protein
VRSLRAPFDSAMCWTLLEWASRRLAMSEGANGVSDRVEWCRRWESNPHET